MRKTSILLILVMSATFLFAQDQNSPKQSLRFGLNGAFWGAGDLLGKSIYGEYVFPVNEYIAISPRIIAGNSTRSNYSISNEGTEFEFDTEEHRLATSMATAIALKFTLFPKSLNNFKVDFGLVHHKWSSVYGQIQTGFNGNESLDFRTRITIGFIGSLNFLLVNNKTTEFGFRADMITGLSNSYLDCLSIQAGFFFGVKLN